eukprot:TRINITY_DN95941_c0_g1_i1.p1 TRINITY_DN95941_c0_g1~~TRINITY_DN95941_c0_g1_i1.p1  ORF type:complete len:458 (-),score=69.85 TRINITY_DN95941_c0_g1_i1:68-1393(-)
MAELHQAKDDIVQEPLLEESDSVRRLTRNLEVEDQVNDTCHELADQVDEAQVASVMTRLAARNESVEEHWTPSHRSTVRRIAAASILLAALALLGMHGAVPPQVAQASISNVWTLFSFPKLQGFPSPAKKTLKCLDNEEELNGLCYQKCSILTRGKAPYRKAPTICCKTSTFLCAFLPGSTVESSGLAIGGGEALESSPHIPGSGYDCLDNEEPYIGLCYKKCSSFRDGALPLRTGPNTCCSGTVIEDCINSDPNTKTELSADFGVGGGTGAKSEPHFPTDISNNNTDSSPLQGPPLKCLENEEEYGGICYQKCSILTSGQMPKRTGPNSCCKKSGFLAFFSCMAPGNSHVDSSYGVGGGEHLQKAPHLAGLSFKCLSDEEESAGICYKKCSLFTQDKPYRASSATCCKDKSMTECQTSALFGEGGFKADAMPHGPYMKTL